MCFDWSLKIVGWSPIGELATLDHAFPQHTLVTVANPEPHQPKADGIENNFRYYGIDFYTGLKQYTEKPNCFGTPKPK